MKEKHSTTHSTAVSCALQVQINGYNILKVVPHHKITALHNKMTKQEPQFLQSKGFPVIGKKGWGAFEKTKPKNQNGLF